MKYEWINAPVPSNITGDDLRFFSSLTPSKVGIPDIKYINNAFVNHQGLVIKNGFLVKGCALNLLGSEDNAFYFPFWKLALEQYLVCKFGKSLKAVNLKGPQQYLLIHSKWFNYSFWINSFILRLIMAEEAGLLPKVKLICPEEWYNIPYVKQSLEVFNVQHEVIPVDDHIFADKLVMPETREWTASFYPPHINKIRERLVPEALKRTTIKDFADRIYLTRRQRRVRCVENEPEVIELLKNYGFKAVGFEDISFWDQVAIMHHAKYFISLHGAGFSNVLFMQAGAKVLELINKPYAKAEYKFPFWKLTHAAGHKYFAQFCDITDPSVTKLKRGSEYDDEGTYLVNQNVITDITLLKTNIEQMLTA
jgi:hypothetical protein